MKQIFKDHDASSRIQEWWETHLGFDVMAYINYCIAMQCIRQCGWNAIVCRYGRAWPLMLSLRSLGRKVSVVERIEFLSLLFGLLILEVFLCLLTRQPRRSASCRLRHIQTPHPSKDQAHLLH